MNLVAAIRDWFASETRYKCGMCGLSLDHERPNCHACGGPVERVYGDE